MSEKKLRLLVMSDLHAVTAKGQSDTSYLSYYDGKSEFAERTLAFLKGLGESWDLLVCPGDITDKADQANFEYGWTFINRLAGELSISKIVAVPGNHDHNSRLEDVIGADPKIHMQYITPQFPTSVDSLNEHFWAWRWCHEDAQLLNIVQIDTSAFHGFSSSERDHGRIHPRTRLHLINHVKSAEYPVRALNLLVCHHHPIPLPIVEGRDDYQAMAGGSELVTELSSANKGAWFVIHGHIHMHYIYNAQSYTSEGPIVFSAGSVAYKSQDDGAGSQNQIHSIEIDLELSKTNGSPYGTFVTWEYQPTIGWQLPVQGALTWRGGFGSSERPTKLANLIQERLGADKQLKTADWLELEQMILHLIPGDLNALEQRLKDSGLGLAKDENRYVGVRRL